MGIGHEDSSSCAGLLVAFSGAMELVKTPIKRLGRNTIRRFLHRTFCCELSSAGMQKQESRGSIWTCRPVKQESDCRFGASLGGCMPAVAGGRKILIVD